MDELQNAGKKSATKRRNIGIDFVLCVWSHAGKGRGKGASGGRVAAEWRRRRRTPQSQKRMELSLCVAAHSSATPAFALVAMSWCHIATHAGCVFRLESICVPSLALVSQRQVRARAQVPKCQPTRHTAPVGISLSLSNKTPQQSTAAKSSALDESPNPLT